MRIVTVLTPSEALLRLTSEESLLIRELLDTWPLHVRMRLQLNKQGRIWAAFVVVKSDTCHGEPFALLRCRDIAALQVLYIPHGEVTASIGGSLSHWAGTGLRAIALHNCNVGDSLLRGIAQVRTLRSINLRSATHSGNVCDWIASMSSLYSIALKGSMMDGGAIATLNAMPRLRQLFIDGDVCVEGGLRSLVAFGHLKRLWFYNSNASHESQAWLRSELPNCEVEFKS